MMLSKHQPSVESVERAQALRSLGVVQAVFGPPPVSMLDRLLGPLDLKPFSSWVEELPIDDDLAELRD
jgi:hypothetical protein